MKVWHRHGPLACALLLAACCRATAQAPPPDPFQEWLTVREALLGARGLVAYYDFQEGDGATLTNRVTGGEALNGTLHEAKWAEGRWPGKHGLAFDGQGAYVEIPHHPGLYPFGADGTDELTLAVSMLADSTAEAGLVDKSSAGWGRDTPYALWITSGAIAAGVGDGTDCTLVRDPVEASTGQWLTLVLVVEATRVRLYKNGLLIASAARGLEPLDSDRPLLIGCMKPGSFHFRGRMDELAIYNRALSAREITRAARMKTVPTIDIP